jgi:AraC family transcriptional regulator, transcriptional activator FtrA
MIRFSVVPAVPSDPVKQSHLVAALLYPPVSALEFGCAAEVFGLARPEIGRPCYSFAAGSMNPGAVGTDSGTSLVAAYGLEIFSLADTIVLPSWDPAVAPPIEIATMLKRAAQRGVRLVATGSGVFLLAAAGLTEGRRVAAHWSIADRLAELHSDLSIDRDALYVDEGQLVTGAGSAASLDLFLHLVKQDFGIRAAERLARSMLTAPHRDGRQAQRLERPVPRGSDLRLQKVLDHLRLNATQSHRAEALAAMAEMSPTNFNRKFRRLVGYSPYDWLIRERVAIARELLEESTLSIDQVGVESGFGSTQSFRNAFMRIMGMAPAAYRRAQKPDDRTVVSRARRGHLDSHPPVPS